MISDPPSVSRRLPTLDFLRGIASLAVCWFHLTRDDGLPFFKASGNYGWLGVEVFFVISGFVIPFALERSDYGIHAYGTFLLKRILRLEPPYFAAVAFILILGFAEPLVPGFHGQRIRVSLPQVLAHLGYMNSFFHYPWLNPVFWTLGVEFQYYLGVGLLFPLLASRSTLVRTCTLFCMAKLTLLIPASEFAFHWLALFMLGAVTFQYRIRLLTRRTYLLWVCFFGLISYDTLGMDVTVVGVLTACVIAFVDMRRPTPLAFFGNISYSLYLVHAPVSVHVVNLTLRLAGAGAGGRTLALALAFGSAIGAAWLLHLYVERPAQRWSSALGYKRRHAAAPSGFGPVSDTP